MHVYILLDRSGSMADMWSDTIGAINTYVKNLPAASRVTLATFDASYGDEKQYEVQRDRVKKEEYVPLDATAVYPRGGTPLYDATAKLINTMIEDDCRKAILVVMTDGHENSSREYNHAAVKAKIEEVKKNDWGLVFMGANFEEVRTISASLNVGQGNTVNVKRSKLGDYATYLSTKTASYNVAAAGARAATMDWSEAEQTDLSTEKA